MKWKTKKVLKKCRKIELSGQYYAKRRKTIFHLYSNRHWLLSIDVKRENYFIFNLTILGFRSLYGVERKKFKKCDTNNAFLSWYGVKKIVHSIVGSNSIFLVVRVWKGKYSFFIINLAKWHFLSLYGAWKEVKIFLFQLSKWTFAVQIVVKKGKSFEF